MYTNTKETADMKQTGGLWQKKIHSLYAYKPS